MLAALLESIVFHVLSSPRGAETIFLPFYRHRAAREWYFCHFIVTAQRGNNIFAILSSPCSAGTISLPFYRHRAARKQHFHVLSSPCSAETIFLPFYRRRAARKQYLCHFIVAVQRGNNIFAILSSPCGAETIFMPFYRRRAARERYFRVSVLAALLRALKFLFSSLRNGDVCLEW